MASEQSLFITTRPKEQTPFIFNIGLYLVLAVCCLACPLKTYIRKKTKLIPLKVSKIYFFDQKKEHQIVSSGQSYSPSLLDRENSINQSGKLDYGKMNSMCTIPNDFPSSRSSDNLNFQKVLLTAQNTSTITTTSQQQNINIADTQLTVVGSTDKTSPNKTLNTKVFLMPPLLESRVDGDGQTSFLLSPVSGGLDKNQYLVTPIRHNNFIPITTTMKTTTAFESSAFNSSCNNQNNLTTTFSPHFQQPKLQSYQHQLQRPKQWNNFRDISHGTNLPPRSQGFPTHDLELGHHARPLHYDQQEEALYSRPHVLKNTNIEAELMSRRQDRDLRRVHYTLHEEDMEYEEYHRYQSPSPAPRQRHQHPADRRHRSRRNFSDERDHYDLRTNKYDGGYLNNTDQAILDDFQYNA